VAETPAERRARIVRSEAARKRAVQKWMNIGARPPPKLAPYTAYATGEASSSHRRPRSPTSPPADEDNADSGRVIGPEDFVKEPTEEELALAKALANTAAEEAEHLATEEAEHHAPLRAVEAFQEREAARVQRLADRVAEAARVLLPPPLLLGSWHRRCR
jgi:hypothetical protein